MAIRISLGNGFSRLLTQAQNDRGFYLMAFCPQWWQIMHKMEKPQVTCGFQEKKRGKMKKITLILTLT